MAANARVRLMELLRFGFVARNVEFTAISVDLKDVGRKKSIDCDMMMLHVFEG